MVNSLTLDTDTEKKFAGPKPAPPKYNTYRGEAYLLTD